MTLYYLLRDVGAEEQTTFAVSGDKVEVTTRCPSRGASTVKTFPIVEARQIWSARVRAGAERYECRDEDGHDGEFCTCPSLKTEVL
jgi:hypothetical protein